MFTAFQRLTLSLFVALGLTSALAQTNSTEVLGTVTANQVSNGLGFNLDANQDWQWAAAAAAGATHARLDCTWQFVEQQTAPPLNQPADPQYVQTDDCVKGFASAVKYGIHPTVVAAFGAPFHAILTVKAPKGAPMGSTSVDIEFVSGVGGDTLANMKYPYVYLSAPSSVTSTTYGKLSYRGSYEGTFITSVKLKDATHATITFASATIDPMPADDTEYTVNEILYPSAASTSPSDPAIIEYGNYVNFLANDMAARGVTGDIEIWNEPPWLQDPWDDRGDLYDANLWPGNETVTAAGRLYANWGFLADLQNRTFPAGITATWNGTSGNGNTSALGTLMMTDTGVAFKQPNSVITKESFHPYGITPEQSNWTTTCLQAAAAATSYPANNPYNCSLSGEHNSNFIEAAFLDAKAKLIDPAAGIGHSITETGALPTKPGHQLDQARFIIRQYLAYQADGVTPIEFYKLYDATTLTDPNFSFIERAGQSNFYTANPAYTTISGFMADINQISNLPVAPYTTSDLASVVSYQGTFPLTSAHMVGSRSGAKGNSEMFAVWQRSVTPCDAKLANCGDIESFLEQASPAAGPATVQIPSGMSVTSVVNLTTRIPVSYTSSGAEISFMVADDPIGILIDPISDKAVARDPIPTKMRVSAQSSSTAYGTPVTIAAVLTPEIGSVAPSNGELVSFYNNQTLLGTGTLSSGVATLNVTSIPMGTSTVAAAYAGDAKLTRSAAYTSVTITAADPSLAFSPVATQNYGVAPFRVTATSNSRSKVHYNVVSGPARLAEDSNAGTIVTIFGTGTVVLGANQTALGNYTAATAQVSFTVVSASSLVFTPIATQTYGNAPFVVSASSSSKAAIKYSVVSGPASIKGATVSVTGIGTVVLEATQGNASIQTTFLVKPEVPSLTIGAIGDQSFGSGPLTLNATSDSSAPITYSVVSGPATVSGNTLTLTGSGRVVVGANQNASGNYAAASAQVSFSVTGGTTSLVLSPVPTQTYGNGPIRLTAVSNSTAAITYSVVSGPASIAANVVTINGVGTVVVSATQQASGGMSGATSQVSFAVQPETPTLTFAGIPNQTLGNGPITVVATSPSPGLVSYFVVSGPASISGNKLTLSNTGLVVVGARQDASGVYASATTQTSFNVNAASLTTNLKITPVSSQVFGSAPFDLSATSNSNGAITFTVVGGPVRLHGNRVSIVGVGTVVINATQAASGTYPAAKAQMSFIVNPGDLTLGQINNQTVRSSVALHAISASPGTISYYVVSGPAKISGFTVTTTGPGTVVVGATQVAAGNYPSATTQTSFVVTSN